MSTLTKIASAAAVVAISASSAFALQTVETSVPTSLQNSRLADAEHIDSVTVNVEQTAAPASIDETLFQTTGLGSLDEAGCCPGCCALAPAPAPAPALVLVLVVGVDRYCWGAGAGTGAGAGAGA